MSLMDFLNELNRGDYDSQLNSIARAVGTRIKVRREYNDVVALANFKVGDRVKLADIRPKYMIGAVGTITEVTDKIKINLDRPHGRFNKVVVCPPNTVRPL